MNLIKDDLLVSLQSILSSPTQDSSQFSSRFEGFWGWVVWVLAIGFQMLNLPISNIPRYMYGIYDNAKQIGHWYKVLSLWGSHIFAGTVKLPVRCGSKELCDHGIWYISATNSDLELLKGCLIIRPQSEIDLTFKKPKPCWKYWKMWNPRWTEIPDERVHWWREGRKETMLLRYNNGSIVVT